MNFHGFWWMFRDIEKSSRFPRFEQPARFLVKSLQKASNFIVLGAFAYPSSGEVVSTRPKTLIFEQNHQNPWQSPDFPHYFSFAARLRVSMALCSPSPGLNRALRPGDGLGSTCCHTNITETHKSRWNLHAKTMSIHHNQWKPTKIHQNRWCFTKRSSNRRRYKRKRKLKATKLKTPSPKTRKRKLKTQKPQTHKIDTSKTDN